MQNKKESLLLIFFLFSLISISLNAQIYKDSTATIDARVDDLMSRMTFEEKIGQMSQVDVNSLSSWDDIKTYYLGSILSGGGSDPSSGNKAIDWADLYDALQAKALQTRLGIPIIYGIDAVHGHCNVEGATIFPHNIGLGATRDAELMREIGRATAVEIAATGIDWTFAPCVAVPRDERWGRTYEGFGETPYLAELLGAPIINGLQGDSLELPTSIVACAKHFIGDGGTTDGVDQGNTEIDEQELRAIHLPGYIAAIKSGVKTIMASYNSWNGVKMHGNKYLLTDVLKNELGFKGFIVSDWAAIDQLPGDYDSQVQSSINAGVDMVMGPGNYTKFLASLKRLNNQNLVTQERIDDAVRRILKVKFQLGLFEHPFTDRSLLSEVGSQAHRNVARKAVRESIVFLKKNDDILPLPKNNVKILVAGKHANDIGLQCGGWTIQWQGQEGNITEGTTILEGLKKIAPNADIIFDANGNFGDVAADYIIAVVGEQPYAEGAGDSDDLSLNSNQTKMIRKLKNRGIPVITILISGRPMILGSELHNSDVFISSWLPGTEGDGIAEVLFGDYAPTGLLPVSWPKSMSQIPINFGDKNYNPQFEYGYGITSFNNSPIGSNPIINSGMVTEDGKHIELSFNKSMNNSENTTAIFSVIKNGNSNISVTDFILSTLDNKLIILDLGDEILKDDQVTLAYTSGNLKAEDGGMLDNFDNIEVINYLKFISGKQQLPGKIQAEDYSDMFGIQTEPTEDVDGGINVGWIDDGDWLEYNVHLSNTGTYFVNFRVASQSSGGKVQFLVDGQKHFSTNIPVTNGWQNWQTITETDNLTSGDFTIRLLAEQGGFNINWFELVTITGVGEENEVISNYHLSQNYPNPFNPTTTIAYQLKKEGFVTLKVFDALGKEVASLVNKQQTAGSYSYNFNANNLTSGLYIYRLNVNGHTESRKMLLLK